MVHPKAPPHEFAKIHVDASTARNHIGGAGADEGNSMCRSSLVIHGINNVVTLKAIACWEALFLVVDLMLHSFIVASDTENIVNDIHRGSNTSYSIIIIEVKSSGGASSAGEPGQSTRSCCLSVVCPYKIVTSSSFTAIIQMRRHR